MTEESQTVQVNVTDPESLARGIQIMVDNIAETGRAVSTLASILGFAIANTDRANNPKMTLADVLLVAMDVPGYSGPIIEILRATMQAGFDLTPPPPKDGVRLIVIQGSKAA